MQEIIKKYKPIMRSLYTLSDQDYFCKKIIDEETTIKASEKDAIHHLLFSLRSDIKKDIGIVDMYNMNNLRKTDDDAQFKTLLRLSKITKEKNILLDLITKKCPHCGSLFNGTSDTKYVICGYNEGGYDWLGCKKDWCFKCGKKLCKSWDDDILYEERNRIHNKDCCLRFAIEHKIDVCEMCQC